MSGERPPARAKGRGERMGKSWELGIGLSSSFGGTDEGEDEADEGGFASSSLAEDGGEGARLEVVREVLDDGAAFVCVVVGHIVKADAYVPLQQDRLTFFFQRKLFQLHQAFAGSEAVDKDRQ